MRHITPAALALLGIAASAFTPAHAVVVQTTINENDCAGYFGQGFDNCAVFYLDETGQKVKISPVIAKFGEDGKDTDEVDQINSAFPTISGDEWTFSDVSTEGKSGNWEYDPDDAADPGIRYWVAKYGPRFTLYFDVDDSSLCTSVLSMQCLEAANVVYEGSWGFLSNGLSHITFYDSDRPVIVSEPAALGLLGFGLILIGFAGRGRTR